MQEKYWYYMVQIKSSLFYLDIYAEESYKWDRRINAFGAIASSSSIAAWAIWEECSYVWGFIIALSQVLTAVKGYFPFAKRLKLLKPFIDDLKVIYLKMEYEWYRVAGGELTEKEINTLLYAHKKDVSAIEGKYLKDDVLIENKNYMHIANNKTSIYFENNF